MEKFFRLGERKFGFLKGVSYGPFAPDSPAPHFASPDQTTRDFAQIRGLQANVLRVYHVPPRWFLDLAAEFELRVLVDIPWSKHLCFLDSSRLREQGALRHPRSHGGLRRPSRSPLRLQRGQRNPS